MWDRREQRGLPSEKGSEGGMDIPLWVLGMGDQQGRRGGGKATDEENKRVESPQLCRSEQSWAQQGNASTTKQGRGAEGAQRVSRAN